MNQRSKVAAPTQIAKKRILLVDDHPIFRHGLEDLLKQQEDLTICGHADSAPAALEGMRNLRPEGRSPPTCHQRGAARSGRAYFR